MPTLEARGVELAFQATGSGPTVALIHETGTTSAAWRPLAAAVSESGARAVTYDRRGWGASSAPDGYRRTTVEEQSEDLAELIAAVGPPAVACGAGIGGAIALDLLLRRPEVVAGAVLVEPHLPGFVPAATEPLSEDRAALIDASNEGGLEAVVKLYLSGALTGLGAGAERLPAELTQAAADRPTTLLAELGATAGWGMPLQRLAGAEHPSAVVTCAGTPSLVREAAETISSRLAGADAITVPGDGPPHLVAPEAVARIALGVTAAT